MGLYRSIRLTQLAVNSNFVNGTDRWAGYNSTISIEGDDLKCVGTGGSNYVGFRSTPTGDAALPLSISGHKYFFKAKGRVFDASVGDIRLFASGSILDTGFAVATPAGSGNWVYPSGIYTADASVLLHVYCSARYADAATAVNKEFFTDYIICYDLTAIFGAGNEPSAAWCRVNLPVFFEGSIGIGRRFGGIGGLR